MASNSLGSERLKLLSAILFHPTSTHTCSYQVRSSISLTHGITNHFYTGSDNSFAFPNCIAYYCSTDDATITFSGTSDIRVATIFMDIP